MARHARIPLPRARRPAARHPALVRRTPRRRAVRQGAHRQERSSREARVPQPAAGDRQVRARVPLGEGAVRADGHDLRGYEGRDLVQPPFDDPLLPEAPRQGDEEVPGVQVHGARARVLQRHRGAPRGEHELRLLRAARRDAAPRQRRGPRGQGQAALGRHAHHEQPRRERLPLRPRPLRLNYSKYLYILIITFILKTYRKPKKKV